MRRLDMNEVPEKPDWRVENAKRTQGMTFRRSMHKAKSATWEHEHCVACWDKFMENGPPGTFKEGYVSPEERFWICSECFHDLQETMSWKLAST
jgi:hypothetical protein